MKNYLFQDIFLVYNEISLKLGNGLYTGRIWVQFVLCCLINTEFGDNLMPNEQINKIKQNYTILMNST